MEDKKSLPILNESIVDCIRGNGDAICIEIASTITDGGYFTKNHPRMRDMVYRTFGKDILAVGGAQICALGDDKFFPVVLGYKFKKLLIGLPTKPQKYDPEKPGGYTLSKFVSTKNNNESVMKLIPGYLVNTKVSDLELLLKRAMDFITKLGLKKVYIPPLNSFDLELSDDKIIVLYNKILDDRFVIVQS